MIVLNRELVVQMWNAAALNFWGLREDEAKGTSFFSLDIGLPVGDLQGPIRTVLAGASDLPELVLPATTRRGKTVRCHVTVAPLRGANRSIDGIILVMEDQAIRDESPAE